MPDFALLVLQEDEHSLPETWLHKMLPTKDRNLLAIKYIVKSSRNELIIYKVDKWEEHRVTTAKEATEVWTLHLSMRRHCGEHLNDFVLSCVDRPLLNAELEKLGNLMGDGTSRPAQDFDFKTFKSAPLSLEEAKGLVAKYYLVEDEQVSISIRSK